MRINYPTKLYNPQLVAIGDDVYIKEYSWLNCVNKTNSPITLEIGNGCSIGRFTHINAYGCIKIEEEVVIAERVHISDASHNYEDTEQPIIHQGDYFRGKVIIKRGAWIGCGAVVLPNVMIGRNAIVGANAVVLTDVPDNCIAVGVPAKIKKQKI